MGLRVAMLAAAAAVFGVVLQTTLLHGVPFGEAIPDFVLIACVYLGLHQQSAGGTTAAFLLGYFADNFSGHAVGLHAFAMTLVFVVVYSVSRQLWMDHWIANVAMVFAASILKTLTVGLLLVFYLGAEYPLDRFVGSLWQEALVAAVFAPGVFFLLDRGRQLLGVE
jgi:rod shape-determining protein MreD